MLGMRLCLHRTLPRSPKPSFFRNYSLHPSLRSRIKAIKTEHTALNEELSQNYTSDIAIKLAKLEPVVDKFAEYETLEAELNELQDLASDSQLGKDATAEIDELRPRYESIESELKMALVPPHPFADRACMLEIRPGIGGSEATLFAADLLKMYQNYCLKRKWPCEVLSINETPTGGITEAILNVKEPSSYHTFQYEGGVHRVQRVPETETKGRVHTSTAAVVVLPDLGSAEESMVVDPRDLRIDVMRASGSGGQHVNTTESAVRIVHLPTNLIVTCQDERSQHKNKAKALKVLQGRLAELDRQAKQKQDRQDRLQQVTSADRSDKSRTYNYPQNRITDHRSGLSSHHLAEIMSGNDTYFDEIVESVHHHIHQEKIKSLE